MSDLLARAGALFLAPAPHAAPAVPVPATAVAAVVAGARDLPAVAGGVAVALRRAAGARTAVVCLPGAPVAPAPATVAAGRLARRLTARGLEATGTGALCHVALPDDAEPAIRLTWRVIAASADAPVVVGVTGRDAERDAFLAQVDRLVLGVRDTADAVYVEVALASLARLGPPAERIVAPSGLVARRAAALGLARLTPPTPEPVVA